MQQLKAAFDMRSLESYYLGGGLVRWLTALGEDKTAERIKQIDPELNISRQLAEAFGMPAPLEAKAKEECRPVLPCKSSASSFAASGSFTAGSPSSFISASSFYGSFNISSSSFSNIYTSFLTGSFYHEYEYEYQSGSFLSSSFSIGSFSIGSFTSGSLSYGSFISSSFNIGSFNYGNFTASAPVSISAASESAAPQPVSASQPDLPEAKPEPQLTPQQKFERNISACHLNRYGYGLHLV